MFFYLFQPSKYKTHSGANDTGTAGDAGGVATAGATATGTDGNDDGGNGNDDGGNESDASTVLFTPTKALVCKKLFKGTPATIDSDLTDMEAIDPDSSSTSLDEKLTKSLNNYLDQKESRKCPPPLTKICFNPQSLAHDNAQHKKFCYHKLQEK